MDEVNNKNTKLKFELTNQVYDVVGIAIEKTAKKHKYQKTDIIKLVETIFGGDYKFLTSDEDYREQIKLLDEYFQKIYNHHVITLELLKAIINNNNLNQDLETLDKITKTPNKHSKELINLLNNKEYDQAMSLIEKDKHLRLNIEAIYEKEKGRDNDKIIL